MDNKDEIEKILADFNQKKQSRESGTEPLAPPVRREEYIDFSKNEESKELLKKPERVKHEKPAPTPEEIEAKKARRREQLEKIKKAVFSKHTLIIIVVIMLAVGGVFGGMAIADYSKTAYLKPYQKKYPDVHFPSGISEKYCDMLGANPEAVGYIEVEDTELASPVFSKKSKRYPMSEDSIKGSTVNNFVVYMNDNSLEALYKDADAYNRASDFISYSDLKQDYTFKVVGAFYTNTRAQDDDGYIFPYNVTEKMTADSSSQLVSRLNSRFVYSTGITITRQDKLLTISCDTEYRKDFRFVVVGVLSDRKAVKPVAANKDRINYPQVIFDEKGEQNPYRFSSKWYPEIIVTDKNGVEKTIQQSIKDYE